MAGNRQWSGVATACNSMVLILDELAEVDPREAGVSAYMLSNGQGKTRAGRDGVARPSATWKVAILSSGEISLADKMAEGGKRAMAGQAVRLIDIDATSRTFGVFDQLHGMQAKDFAEAAKAVAANSYGTAGREFVKRMLDDRISAMREASELMAAFTKLATDELGEVTSQVGRVIGRLAVFAAAGEMATRWNITGWPEGTANQAMLEMLRIWIAGRGGTGNAEAKEARERLEAFLLQHAASRLEDLAVSEEDRKPVARQAGWRDKAFFYLNKPAMQEIMQGLNMTAAMRALVDAELLKVGDGKNLMRRTDKVKGRPRTYHIPLSAIDVTTVAEETAEETWGQPEWGAEF